jgi:UDP-N-acetylglucosamine 2-epimerase
MVNNIAIVTGTRPQFIELAPIIHELKKVRNSEILVYNTEQHYDKNMSRIFFEQLRIPQPNGTLEVREGTHAQQTGKIMIRTERLLMTDRPNVVVVEGDTNSALGAALAASKLKIPVIHIEAGCRAFDKTLPEEINRVIISHVASLHFAPTRNCQTNLEHEGISSQNIKMEGHPIVDSINIVKGKLRPVSDLNEMKGRDLEPRKYYFLTMHRDFNVDDPARLESILKEIDKIASAKKPVVFAIHPRTRKRIQEFGLSQYLQNMTALDPVGYISSLSLISNAYAVISDSGGLTKESALLGTPCITLRPNTEWKETLEGYCNQLAFTKDNSIRKCVERLDKNYDDIVQNARLLNTVFGEIGLSAAIAKTIRSWDFSG